MTDDQIRAAIERVREWCNTWGTVPMLTPEDLLPICDFAAARLAEPAKGEPCPKCGGSGKRGLGILGYVPCLDCNETGRASPAPPVAPEPAADAGSLDNPAFAHYNDPPPDGLVDLVSDAARQFSLSPPPAVGAFHRNFARFILTALAGRIVQPGMVAVPVDALKSLHEHQCRSWGHYKRFDELDNARLEYGRAQGVELAAKEIGLTLGDPISDRASRRRAAGGQP